jgi:hypothetical protein
MILLASFGSDAKKGGGKSNFKENFMKPRIIPVLLLSLFVVIANAHAQGTAFTYNGRLNAGGGPANGSYDLSFTLFPASSGGTQAAAPVTNAATTVSNGLFTVTLDFGMGIFNGTSYWLQIGVRTNGNASFTKASKGML